MTIIELSDKLISLEAVPMNELTDENEVKFVQSLCMLTPTTSQFCIHLKSRKLTLINPSLEIDYELDRLERCNLVRKLREIPFYNCMAVRYDITHILSNSNNSLDTSKEILEIGVGKYLNTLLLKNPNVIDLSRIKWTTPEEVITFKNITPSTSAFYLHNNNSISLFNISEKVRSDIYTLAKKCEIIDIEYRKINGTRYHKINQI